MNEVYGFAIHKQRFHLDPSPFFFRQFHNARAHAGIRIGNGAGSHIHHAFRLKGIEKQMKESAIERIRTVVLQFRCHFTVVLVQRSVQGDIHGVINGLLPPGILR